VCYCIFTTASLLLHLYYCILRALLAPLHSFKVVTFTTSWLGKKKPEPLVEHVLRVTHLYY
jgi:hypothetical protein